MKSQFFPNMADWQLGLATGLSRGFKLRDNGPASLGLLSCSVTVGATFQLPMCASHMPTVGGLPVASQPRVLAAKLCFLAHT